MIITSTVHCQSAVKGINVNENQTHNQGCLENGTDFSFLFFFYDKGSSLMVKMQIIQLV